MKSYYYVYRHGGEAPTIRHECLQSAQVESERLARVHKGERFEILKCIGVSSVMDVHTEWTWDPKEGEF